MSEYADKLRKRLQTFVAEGTLTPSEAVGAENLFTRYHDHKPAPIDWAKVGSISDREWLYLEDLPKPLEGDIKMALRKVAILKLNGGLGTSMGCAGPKTEIKVKNSMSFLEIIIRQVHALNKAHGANIPLIFMNSFNTEKPTKELIATVDVSKDVNIICFNQAHFPRLDAATLMPYTTMASSCPAYYYPPGHGDVLRALLAEGIVDRLLSEGIEYIFISNGDNLGATLDLSIASYLCRPENKYEFIAEQTPKTLNDVKGGVLINYEGKIHLLETAQVPKEHMEDFCNIEKFTAFNVNNIWVSASGLKKLEGKSLDLDLIVNPKTVEGIKTIQLESAVGAGIALFHSRGLLVPRSRFVPVKKCSDLLIVQSDCYELDSMYNITCTGNVPIVEFDETLNKIQGYNHAFKCIPSIKNAKHIKMHGQICIGSNVQFQGCCELEGTMEKPISVENAVLGS